MRIIGICRFSYPALGGFKRMHETVEEREAYLYAPDRMALRFRHFENLTLPSVAAQKDQDFTFLVLIGDSLPKPYLERLHDVTAGIPQIRIVKREPMRHRLAMQHAIKAELGLDEPDSFQFRLDDDDAIAVQFISGLRWFARHTEKMRKNWENMAVEYSSGFTVRLSETGIEARNDQAGFLACGLAAWFRAGHPKTVMNYAHHKLHHTMPTFIHPKAQMYLRSKHDDNDSAARIKADNLKPLSASERDWFKTRFNVDEDLVKAAFSDPIAFHDTA